MHSVEESPSWAVWDFHKRPPFPCSISGRGCRECLIHLCCWIFSICPSRSTVLLSLPDSVLPGADLTGSISWAPLLSGKERYQRCQIRVFILSASSIMGQELAMASSTKDFSPWQCSSLTPVGFFETLVADSACLFRPCCCVLWLQSLSSVTIPYQFLLTLLYIFLGLNLFSNPSLGLTAASCWETN